MNNFQILRLVPLFLLLLISTVLATGLLNPKVTQGQMLKKELPPFNIDLVNDPSIKMTLNTWKDQVAVINIFASWCKPCQAEHPVLMRLAQTGKVNIYGIAWRDEPANTVKFLSALGNPYQKVGNDNFARTTVAFSLTGVPETMVVGRDNIVYYHHVSALTDDEVNNVILPLVDKLNAAHVRSSQAVQRPQDYVAPPQGSPLPAPASEDVTIQGSPEEEALPAPSTQTVPLPADAAEGDEALPAPSTQQVPLPDGAER